MSVSSTNSKGPAIKILINGESGVGKSSLLQRYTLGTFDENIASTIGVDFRVARLSNVNEHVPIVRLEIWDTAGQERFKTLSASYYRNAAAALFVYDVTNRDSFNALKRWMEDTVNHCGPNIVMMLVANKIDKLQQQQQQKSGDDGKSTAATDSAASFESEEQSKAEEFAREHQMLYCRCSAKTKEGVAHAFEEVARIACERPEFKEKYGLDSASSGNSNSRTAGGVDGSAADGTGSPSMIGKRIDLNRTREDNNGNEGSSYLGGCSAC